MLILINILMILLMVAGGIIFVQVILSWLVAFNIINTHNDYVRALLNWLERITAPIYRPIRKVLPDFGGIDFSPMVVLLILLVLNRLLESLWLRVALSSH